jgi:hypothetical protein
VARQLRPFFPWEQFCPKVSVAPVAGDYDDGGGVGLKRPRLDPAGEIVRFSPTGPSRDLKQRGQHSMKAIRQCEKNKGRRERVRNRKQRRELARKIQSGDVSLEVVHPDAAGIDIGK